MKAYVRHIGVISENNHVHSVSFDDGVNVVTGKSSTGKSALIEIFDYCFGSSDFTVPDGVITQVASIFFTVMRVGDVDVVLARKPKDSYVFLKEELDIEMFSNLAGLTLDYFESSYFVTLSTFKKELGRFFGLTVTDVDESAEDKERRGRKESGPSVRSFSSFILQHQNLIANKHAIFYRFDEKAKRDQAIDHFKIFCGFVDQEYFVKSQELGRLLKQKRILEIRAPKAAEERQRDTRLLEAAILEYAAISGESIGIEDPEAALKSPRRTLNTVKAKEVRTLPTSDEAILRRDSLEKSKALNIGELRQLQNRLMMVKSSVDHAKAYIESASAIALPSSVELHASECPFCHSQEIDLEEEANQLSKAIGWLNSELRRSPYMLESFEEEAAKIERDVTAKKQEIQVIEKSIAAIDLQIKDLKGFKTQHELSLKAKLKVEGILEAALDRKAQNLDEELRELNGKIEELSKDIRENYNVNERLDQARQYIDNTMKDIGARFEFEESYKPINLKFSLDTFDLWHEASDRKVFLRSMGSGANWLYCHLTLFLALHRYFCSLGIACSIPSILFIDQPSQVYFPSVLDVDSEFDAKKLADKEGNNRKRAVDEDIKAVTNLYSQLVRFCDETFRLTGIRPQIIITDHADHLTLEEGLPQFESLVNGRRWRNRGFIDPVPTISEG